MSPPAISDLSRETYPLGKRRPQTLMQKHGIHAKGQKRGCLLPLAALVDLFSRQVVGWLIRQNMTRDIGINAALMTWFKHHVGMRVSLIFHNARGSQYATEDFPHLLKI